MRISNNKKSGRIIVLVISVLAVVGILGFFLIYIPVSKLIADSKGMKTTIKSVKDALLLQDLPTLKANLDVLDGQIVELNSGYSKMSFLSFIPVVNSYYNDGKHFMNISRNLLMSGKAFITAVIPYSAKLGFKGGDPKEPIVGGQERLAGLVKVAPALNDKYQEISAGLHDARTELDKVDVKKYPEKFGGTVIRSNLVALKNVLDSLDSSAEDVRNLLSEIPTLLGEPNKVSYLILFQNDKEIRPTGGFLTAYAVFTLEKGRIISVTSGDMYFLDIDNRVPFYPPAPEVIKNYLKIKDWYIRDSNLSPDFKTSAATLEEFWARVPGVPKIGGIIAIDTHFVESLVGILGDISIPGYEKFTKDNITYQLEVYATVIGSKLEKRGGRKDLIGVLMQQMMQKAFSQSSKQYGKVFEQVWKEAVNKHVLVYFHSPLSQSLAEKYNFAGRVVDYPGDYLNINDANFAGRKANWFIVEKVNKKVERKNGKLVGTLEIVYENTGDYNADFNTGYRDYVRVLVPLGSKLISANGSLNPTVQLTELGKTVFASYMAVDPKKKATLSLEYELPESILQEGKYQLMVQKQPGSPDFEYTINIGRKSEKFNLDQDRTVHGNL